MSQSVSSAKRDSLEGLTICFQGNFLPAVLNGGLQLVEVFGGKVTRDPELADVLVVPDPPAEDAVGLAKRYQNRTSILILAMSSFADQFLAGPDKILHALGLGLSTEIWEQLPQAYIGVFKTRIDLSGCDLSGFDLRGTNWTWVEIAGAKMYRVIGTGMKLTKIAGVQLDESKLDSSTVFCARDCSFRNCILDRATIYGNIENTTFENASLVAIIGRGIECTGSVSFANCDLRTSNLSTARLTSGDFTGADLSGSNLCQTNLTNACLTNAKLRSADISEARLTAADLRNADFSGANLCCADMTAADIEGADFTGANMAGTRLSDVDVSRATGLKEALANVPAGTLGPGFEILGDVMSKAKRVEFSVEIDCNNRRVQIELSGSAHGYRAVIRDCHRNAKAHRAHLDTKSLEEAIQFFLYRFWQGQLQLDTLAIKTSKSPVSGKQLKELITSALKEAFVRPEHLQAMNQQSEQARKERENALKARREALRNERAKNSFVRDERLAMLRKGHENIDSWNQHSVVRRRTPDFSGAQLVGLDLRGIDLAFLNFSAANFSGSNLSGANLNDSTNKKTSFENCALEGANLNSIKATDADFSGANLSAATARRCDFRKANFSNANLSGADLSDGNVCQANFSDAILQNCNLEGASFDDNTVFPETFLIPDSMQWKGKDLDPRAGARSKMALAAGPLDFEAFITTLTNNFDSEKLKKALKMLKSDRFQLFVEVTADKIVGVVKSQNDPDLVYSCILKSDGQHSCCTQNLFACGGLRGALCKHLLVLLIGSTRAEKLDSSNAVVWIINSRTRKPVSDKETATETFLRYQSAQEGMIDWRPTETVPEDYYAF